MLFCSTIVGLPFLVPPMILTGELFKAWSSCSEVRTMLTLFLIFSLSYPYTVTGKWKCFWSQITHSVPSTSTKKKFLGEINNLVADSTFLFYLMLNRSSQLSHEGYF